MTTDPMNLLENLTGVQAPSGSEGPLKAFIKQYVHDNAANWRQRPVIYEGDHLQDCLILAFGRPRTAIFAHMDSIGYTAGHHQRLEAIGKPQARDGTALIGTDKEGSIEATLRVQEPSAEIPSGIWYEASRPLEPGAPLTYKPHYQENGHYIQSPYIDNRGGVYNALRVAETLRDGALCFSCWEEHGGGSVGYLARHLYEGLGVRQALIADITWVTADIHHGHGPAISLRDRGVPRRAFVDRVLASADQAGIPYQKEVEGDGGSDGLELQRSPYPFDWCFIGAGETNVHRPDETIHKDDLEGMVKLYSHLMEAL